MTRPIKVLYTSRMVADSESSSPSAGKPAEVIKSWKQLGVPIEIIEPDPVTEDDFSLAHDRRFVSGILAGRARVFGAEGI